MGLSRTKLPPDPPSDLGEGGSPFERGREGTHSRTTRAGRIRLPNRGGTSCSSARLAQCSEGFGPQMGHNERPTGGFHGTCRSTNNGRHQDFYRKSDTFRIPPARFPS